jgi:hypothetical protein
MRGGVSCHSLASATELELCLLLSPLLLGQEYKATLSHRPPWMSKWPHCLWRPTLSPKYHRIPTAIASTPLKTHLICVPHRGESASQAAQKLKSLGQWALLHLSLSVTELECKIHQDVLPTREAGNLGQWNKSFYWQPVVGRLSFTAKLNLLHANQTPGTPQFI